MILVVVAKPVTAYAFMAAFGYPIRTGLTVSAGLGQIGEFSFIIGTLALSLGLLTAEGFQLIVAGAIASITLNPFMFRAIGPLTDAIARRPQLAASLVRGGGELAEVRPDDKEGLRGHAILCGYGRVGRMLGSALERRGFRYVVITQDRKEVERARARGIAALYGDAANEELLMRAGIEDARVVIVAMSDRQAARLIVGRARALNPRVDLVVRTHNDTEAAYLRGLGGSVQAIHGERELAVQMTRYSLRRFGVSAAEAEAIAQGLRTRADPRFRRSRGSARPGAASECRGAGPCAGPTVASAIGRRPVTRSRARTPAAGPIEPVEFLRSLVPLGLLGVAAFVPILRLPVLLLLIGGTAVAIGRDAPVRWAWAATVPVATSLAWGVLLVPQARPGGLDCTDPLSPITVFRVAEAVVVLIVLATFAWWLNAPRSSLALRWPRPDVVRLSAIGFLIVGPVGLVVGPILARPFFGPIDYDATRLAALVPALLFAVANGTMEEVAYRGALLGWSGRVVGVWPAVVGQGIVFGLAHSGGDVLGNGLPLMVVLGAGGVLAGAITVRTRSLLFPLAIHIGLDIPLYYGLACSS